MKAPVCRLCGAAHWNGEPHKLAVSHTQPAVSHTDVANAAAVEPSTYRYRDADVRRVYMRDLMKERRSDRKNTPDAR